MHNVPAKYRYITVLFLGMHLCLFSQVDTNVKVFKHKDLMLIEPTLYDYNKHLFDPEEEALLFAPFVSDESLQTSGSITRGITVGSNRDLSVDANLNLQINGMLSEELSITAFISDENIPLQASSAYTLQGKDFDRVYIRLDYKDKARIWAGDVEIRSNDSYFLRFNKQAMGLKGESQFRDTARNAGFGVKAAVAVAKGNFCRQTIQIVDGIQGAYRLYGNQNETQIIILSASEKVYVDGVLMERGEDKDYTIDYNLAEITFTVRQPMTSDKRVVIEFEYSDQNYVRTILHLQTKMKKNHWAMAFDFYNEQDLKHQSNQLELDAASVEFLKNMGNSSAFAYYPVADSVGFIREEVLYKRIDTLVSGQCYDSVYVYTTNKDSACYRLRFSYLGEGMGNYIRIRNSVNGQIYAWVAPENGVKQGAYEPVVMLVAPKRMQQYSLRMLYEDKGTYMLGEAALSNNDHNTFAPNPNSLLGSSLRFRARHDFRFGKKNEKWLLTPSVYYELKESGFEAVNEYRDVEFMRDYNLSDSITEQNTEHFLQAALHLRSPFMNTLGWQSVFYLIPSSEWEAIRQQLSWHFHRSVLKTNADIRLMQSKSAGFQTDFWEGLVTASLDIWKLQIGVKEDWEWNEYSSHGDSLMQESQAYNEWTLFLCQKDSSASFLKYRVAYGERNQFAVWDQLLQPYSFSRQMQADLELKKWRNHPLFFSLAYRSVESRDSLWTEQPRENTLLGSLNYQGRFAKGAVQTSLYYAVGSAMEDKIAYTYIRVADGQGVYQWNDYNSNGIEELNEFETAVYRDKANYIRVYQVSLEKEKVYANTCTQSLVLRPSAVWQHRKGIRKMLAYFVNTTTFQSQLKRVRDEVLQTPSPVLRILNPYEKNVNDSLLNSANIQLRNTLVFNPSNPVYGVELQCAEGENKYMTVNGSEYSSSSSYQLLVRYKLKERLQSKLVYRYTENCVNTSYLSNRNYALAAHETGGWLQYPFGINMSLGVSYAYKDQRNTIGEECAYIHKLTADMTCRFSRRGSLYVQCQYNNILFKGDENSPVAYWMMESLSNGNNLVLNTTYQTKMGEFLQMDVSYECRILTNASVCHLGSVSVRALF